MNKSAFALLAACLGLATMPATSVAAGSEAARTVRPAAYKPGGQEPWQVQASCRMSAQLAPVRADNCPGVSGNTEKGVPAAAQMRAKRCRSASSSSVTGPAYPSGD